MIRHVTPELEPQLLEALAHDPVYGCRVHTFYQCYGNRYDFCDVWVQLCGDRATGALARYGAIFTLVGRADSNWAEFAALLSALGADEVEGLWQNLEALRPHWEGSHFADKGSPILEYRGPVPDDTANTLYPPEQPREVYDLLCQCFQDFESMAPYDHWLSDHIYKLRQGLCQMLLCREETLPVSVAMVAYQSDRSGVIGSVATAPEHRGKGYAKSIVLELVKGLMRKGKTPFVLAQDCELSHFYRSLGFQNWGKRGTLTRERHMRS